MIENVKLKQKGAKWWHTEDHASPNLTKTSLGLFFYHVLKVGAQIGSIWPFNPKYDKSSVFITVFMTDEMMIKLENETKFRFKPPPKVHVK